MNNNFTLSNDWLNALPIRYNISNLINVNNELYFYNDNGLLKCQSYFDFNIQEKTLDELSNILNDGYILKFSYINEKLYNYLNNWANNNKFEISIIDSWQNPKLTTTNIINHLKNNEHAQVRKNYKRYLKSIDNYIIKNSSENDAISLWKDVLYIDYNSWKGNQHSDMKSLDREDLQYIFYLINNKNNASLNVLYDNDLPAAYSLMFRASLHDEWYAVKWGASNYGRIKYLGIFCLFNHLIKLSENDNYLKIDFWGRRSQTYDYLKTSDIKRMHIEIKKGDKNENSFR